MRRLAAPCSPAEEKHTDSVPNLAHRSYTGRLSDRPDTLLRPHDRKRSPAATSPPYRETVLAYVGTIAGSLSPKRNGACQVGSSRTRSSTPPPRGTPRRWPNCSPKTTATSPTAAGSGSSFAARGGFLPSCSTRWEYRVDNRAGLWPGVGLHLEFATSAHLRVVDRRITGGIDRQSCFASAARVAEVLARGPFRGDLQAHLAVARVAEQPSATTPSSLLRWTKRGIPSPGCRKWGLRKRPDLTRRCMLVRG